MEILSVSLKNFKSHSDRLFSFQPGTNAICGENGAGKTSILEAIAWVLFNYKGGYKTEDLIRNGAASAQVNVTFVSNRDQRTYEVGRCTRAGYTLYDPQLGKKLEYSLIEDEVLPWLRQHFGVTPGTDLADLFSNTIGVPQGLFTVDFLKPDRERKKTFDTILKVDEYRNAFDRLLPLSKYAEAAVKDLEKEIASYEEALEEFDLLSQKSQAQTQEIEQAKLELSQLQTQRLQLQQEQEQLGNQAAQLQQLETQTERLAAQIKNQTEVIERLQANLRQAEHAVTICTDHRDSYHTFLQVEQRLQELEQQWHQEQDLHQKKRQQEKLLGDRLTQRGTLTLQLEEIAAAKAEITRLEPLIQQQVQLEQAQQTLNQKLQACVGWREAVRKQEKQLAQLQTRGGQISQERDRILALEPFVQQIPGLEQQQQRYQQQLSRIEAAVQFETELQRLLAQAQGQGDQYLADVHQAETTLKDLQQAMPIWENPLKFAVSILHRGADQQNQWITAIQEILADLAEQTSPTKLEQQLERVQQELQTARQHQSAFATLDSLLERQRELEAEAEQLENSLTELKAELESEPLVQEQLGQHAEALEQLNDPRGQSRLLLQKLQQEPKLRKQLQELQGSLDSMEEAIASIDKQLAEFANLSEQMAEQRQLRENHRAPYEEYLAYRELANTRRERQQQLQEQSDRLTEWQQASQQVVADRDRLTGQFDPVHFQAVQALYQQVNERCVALNASLPDKQKRLEDLEHQLTRLAAIRAKRNQAQSELLQKRKIDRFVKFARKAYKEAGPRITERYVQSISREADKLFRELLNRPNVGLEWTRDYEILVQEGAHSRRFINLSGGEQMCAALAVRLALLKVLADIDIAFFDEPTTNMDRPRRESLAEAIANIKTFRQIFVISHDDTFEKVTENVIEVTREV